MNRQGLWRAASLAVFGLLLISFTFTAFAQAFYMVSALSTKLILHVLVIITVIAYLLFTEKVYRAVNTPGSKTVFMFAVVFAAPALLVRALEICVLFVRFKDTEFIYGLLSVARLSEFVLWTVALPVSLLFLLNFFSVCMEEKPLLILCAIAAFSCILTLVCMAYPEPIILWSLIGMWAMTFVGTVFIYIVKALTGKAASKA